MPNLKKITVLALLELAVLPGWAGTGRPSDGFLSFVILLGFLLLLLGILHLATIVKRKIHEFLDDIF
jgi:hypothetical protein